MKTLLTALATAATLAFTPLAGQAETLTTGAFSGANDHITQGGVTIVKTADGGAVVILDSDFSLDGAPDPRVGFGKDGTYVGSSDLGALQNLSGVQVYVVPPSVNVADYNEIYIWCLQFGVSLGQAKLTH